MGKFWTIEHAYPSGLKGWLVIVLNRHCTSLHELEDQEFIELGLLQAKTTRLIRREIGCSKEYVMCLAEAVGFEHIHFHVVPRMENIPTAYMGSKIFAYLKCQEMQPIARDEVAQFCVTAREFFSQDS